MAYLICHLWYAVKDDLQMKLFPFKDSHLCDDLMIAEVSHLGKGFHIRHIQTAT